MSLHNQPLAPTDRLGRMTGSSFRVRPPQPIPIPELRQQRGPALIPIEAASLLIDFGELPVGPANPDHQPYCGMSTPGGGRRPHSSTLPVDNSTANGAISGLDLLPREAVLCDLRRNAVGFEFDTLASSNHPRRGRAYRSGDAPEGVDATSSLVAVGLSCWDL